MRTVSKTFIRARLAPSLSMLSGVLGTAALFSSCAHAAPPSAEALARIREAAPARPAARPAKARRILVYTRANGFRHSSIETGGEAMKILGEKTGAWAATVSDDPAMFDNLAQFDAVVFLNTTGDALLPAGFNDLPEDQKTAARATEERRKAALLSFVNSGKGFAGVHAATDTMYGWADYGKMIGGYFDGHPWNAGDDVTVRVEDSAHPVTRHLNGAPLAFKEEIYQFKEPYSRQSQRVLMGLDLDNSQRKEGLKRADRDYAVTWVKPQGAGRVFYCSLGHNEAMYSDPRVAGVYLAGIQYAIGDLKADATPIAQAPTEVADAPLGEYAAPLGRARNAPQVLARVFPLGNNEYRAVLYWPDTTRATTNPLMSALMGRRIEMTGTRNGDAIEFSGKDGDADIKASWTQPAARIGARPTPATLRLTQMSPAMTLFGAPGGGMQPTVEMQKFERTSPTLGMAPPRGAVELIPYARDAAKRASGPSLAEWRNQNWIPLSDGSVRVRGGDNVTKREFGDARIHVEFQTPLQADRRGQQRGNSGVYLQERYEVQVLDSFGLDHQDNDIGGIYRVAKAKVNAGLPPGRWQTYDITFRAPRLYADGSLAKAATATVVLNGVTIHDNITIPQTTGGGASGFVAKAPLKLQDHGDPVRYRNVWVQELTDQPWTPVANPDPNAGAQVLFDGKSLDAFAWGEGKPAPQLVGDGSMLIQGGGDVWTKDQYENFVLDLEWKVGDDGNSGIFIRNPKPGDWYAGQEIQVANSFGQNPGVHTAGANYDVQAPSKNTAKPAGEWNQMRITARGQNIVVELNGEKVLDQDLNRWTEAGKNPDGTNNKFKTAYKDMPKRGHIELQDHGQRVWYRNIRVRELK